MAQWAGEGTFMTGSEVFGVFSWVVGTKSLPLPQDQVSNLLCLMLPTTAILCPSGGLKEVVSQ